MSGDLATGTTQIWGPLWLTVQLAGITTICLILIGTPLAWWLARSRWRLKPAIEAIVALPLVLPPTVLGFYLLVAMGPQGIIGAHGSPLPIAHSPSALLDWLWRRVSTRCHL